MIWRISVLGDMNTRNDSSSYGVCRYKTQEITDCCFGRYETREMPFHFCRRFADVQRRKWRIEILAGRKCKKWRTDGLTQLDVSRCPWNLTDHSHSFGVNMATQHCSAAFSDFRYFCSEARYRECRRKGTQNPEFWKIPSSVTGAGQAVVLVRLWGRLFVASEGLLVR